MPDFEEVRVHVLQQAPEYPFAYQARLCPGPQHGRALDMWPPRGPGRQVGACRYFASSWYRPTSALHPEAPAAPSPATHFVLTT